MIILLIESLFRFSLLTANCPLPFAYSPASKMPLRPLVTFCARRKIIAAKSSLARVASCTTLRPGRRVVVERKRRGHLTALRHSRPKAMTFITAQFLGPAMLRVTESDLESCRLSGRS